MTAAELAAYIGAAAWLPQIGALLWRKFTTPVVTIVPDRTAEIGFTPYGPIFNVRLALSAERRDVIVDDFRLEVVHEDGEKRIFRWAGLQEDLGETRDALGVRQGRLTKDQEPIALKIGTITLIEKLVRFQEPRFAEEDRPTMQALVEHFNFLKSAPDYVAAALKSKEFHTAVEGRMKSFWWKPGRYTVTFQPSSLRPLKVARSRYSMTLTSLNVDQLKQNVTGLKADLENTIKSNLPDFEVPSMRWNWAYPTLIRID